MRVFGETVSISRKEAIYWIVFIVFVSLMGLNSCTDATISGFKAYGDPHKITLYSGGIAVREWVSTGKVETENSSDGYTFKDAETGVYIRVSGNTVVEVMKP